MVTLEENMTNLHNEKTRVTVGDSATLTGTKLVKLAWLSEILSYISIIPVLHENLFSMT